MWNIPPNYSEDELKTLLSSVAIPTGVMLSQPLARSGEYFYRVAWVTYATRDDSEKVATHLTAAQKVPEFFIFMLISVKLSQGKGS